VWNVKYCNLELVVNIYSTDFFFTFQQYPIVCLLAHNSSIFVFMFSLYNDNKICQSNIKLLHLL
jgi:hypothetical protein